MSVQGEKHSGDKDQFVSDFRLFVKFTLNQIFYFDETGLNFRLMILALRRQQVESKEHVTLNLCSNASGTIKLPARNMDMKLLPVKYTNQKNAWMTTDQFIEWFHNDFVPYVSKELESLGEKPTAVLVLDN